MSNIEKMVRTIAGMLARMSHYVSTYCQHDDHEHCRLTCKTCGQPCRCRCHQGGRA